MSGGPAESRNIAGLHYHLCKKSMSSLQKTSAQGLGRCLIEEIDELVQPYKAGKKQNQEV